MAKRELVMEPTLKAINAAYAALPYNDLLYGDTTKVLSMEELITIRRK
jgi:hypothetical protein